MDKQPTAEQIKELWEWCGFKFQSLNELPAKYRHIANLRWLAPNSSPYSPAMLPVIDLNNLFKYAMPKINWWSISSGVMNCVVVEVRIYTELGVDYKGGKYEGYVDPALALFWAIWEVIHG